MNSSLLRRDPIAIRLMMGSSRSAAMPWTYCGVTAVSSITTPAALAVARPVAAPMSSTEAAAIRGDCGNVVKEPEQAGAHRVSVIALETTVKNSPGVRGEELCAGVRRAAEPLVAAAVHPDEHHFGAIGAAQCREAVHLGADGVFDGRGRAVIEVAPPSGHRRRRHDVTGTSAADHRTAVVGHNRIRSAMRSEDGHRARRRAANRRAQRPGNGRDCSDDVGSLARKPVGHEGPADRPVANT